MYQIIDIHTGETLKIVPDLTGYFRFLAAIDDPTLTSEDFDLVYLEEDGCGDF